MDKSSDAGCVLISVSYYTRPAMHLVREFKYSAGIQTYVLSDFLRSLSGAFEICGLALLDLSSRVEVAV